MSWHELWHVAVLAATLLGVAGVVLALLMPLLFDADSTGRSRRVALGLALGGLVLLAVEWLGIHGGSV